jgi:hypothetical protein
MGLAEEVGHEGVHARRGEEDGGVVLGDEGTARDLDMALGLEKIDVFSAEFVGRNHEKEGISRPSARSSRALAVKPRASGQAQGSATKIVGKPPTAST